MQAAIRRYGFSQCGTIYLPDGSPRLASDYHQSKNLLIGIIEDS